MPDLPHTPTSAVHRVALERIAALPLRTPGAAREFATAALRPIPDHRRRLPADSILEHARIEVRAEARAAAEAESAARLADATADLDDAYPCTRP